MGRYSWSNRYIVELCQRFGIADLAGAGVFEKGPGHYWSYSWQTIFGEQKGSIGYWFKERPDGRLYLELSYISTDGLTGERTPMAYGVDMTTTPCNFGGVRHWFFCPLVVNGKACGRRIGKLYMPPGAKYFGCRNCHDLTYRCQQEHDKRLDAAMKNPEILLKALECGDLKAASLAMRVNLRLLSKGL